MNRLNLGCGPDVKPGWTNADKIKAEGVWCIDFVTLEGAPWNWNKDKFDFVLINHVLCTMMPTDADKVLQNVYKILKPGGKVQIIDMDIEKAIDALQNGKDDLIPASGDTIDEKFCNHVSGYGTRRSLYTDDTLERLLIKHGYKDPVLQFFSEYDLRPNESLIVEASK